METCGLLDNDVVVPHFDCAEHDEDDEEAGNAMTSLLQSPCNPLDTIEEEEKATPDTFQMAAVTLVLSYCVLLAVAVGFVATVVVARGVWAPAQVTTSALFSLRKHKHS